MNWTLLDTFLNICVHLVKCAIKKQIKILLFYTYVSIWLKDFNKKRTQNKELDTFGRFWTHLDTFLNICVHLVKCVIKKQIQILLLDIYVSIWLKIILKASSKLRTVHFWTLFDAFGHFLNYMCQFN